MNTSIIMHCRASGGEKKWEKVGTGGVSKKEKGKKKFVREFYLGSYKIYTHFWV